MSDEKTDRQNGQVDKDIQDLVIERDSGARQPRGLAGLVLTLTALAWSLFQLWIASPLPFEFGFWIFNDTEARSIHLAFALFLAYTAYPTFISSPRHYIPIQDWILALVASFTAAYLYIFYLELADRPGMPTQTDIIVSCVGIVLLLEAARRSLGLPLLIVGIVFLVYTFFGSADWMPSLIQHKGQSLEKVASHQWLSTEGVFGIALGVSASFVFLFVLFGALLDKAGAGNYFIKVAFSLLGHLRGGPAKAAVLASGLTGFISGSSIANVVTTGTFTIPLMKRVGFSPEKAGAVEVSGSINGQIMPPVMGAAAFLMVEYVGIPYQDVIKHAFLPAVISYIALLYIVHLEALKNNMQVLEKPITTTLKHKLLAWGIIITSLVIFASLAFYGIRFLKEALGESAAYVIGGGLLAAYILLVRYAARYPDLEPDNPDSEVVSMPETGSTVKTGLHFLLPVVILIWSLMVERLSPGLSAFWACAAMIFILLTQRPLLCLFRKEKAFRQACKNGVIDLMQGLIAGARNMIGIGVATAAAGIIVGTVSLTGIGQIMTEVVEALSGGSLVLVLIFTAIISLILGMGLPTTANYIVVSSIMVMVVEELGQQHGLLVPAIAIHLFVFYFGIMADVTPPVGLASFASSAISKGDPIRTGMQGFVYSTRTAILPFFFIFNTELLMIGVDTIGHGLFVFAYATVAILVFSAALQGYFLTRSRWYETLILFAVAVSLFLPRIVWDQFFPPFQEMPGKAIEQAVMDTPPGEAIRIRLYGENAFGEMESRYMRLTVKEGETSEERLEEMGLVLRIEPRKKTDRVFVDDVVFASEADVKGVFFDDEITTVMRRQEQPSRRLLYLPSLALLAIVALMQRRRMRERVFVLNGT